MPIALSPRETFPVSLKSDADRPEPDRPTFTARFLSVDTHLSVTKLQNAAMETTDDAAAWPLLREALGLQLAGWRNMGEHVYGKAELSAFLTPSEAWELTYLCTGGQRLAESDKKKSSSPSTTAAAPSAASAGDSTAAPRTDPTAPT